MAAGTANVRYAKSAVYGSLAYDYNTVRDYAVPEEVYAPPVEQPKEAVRERAVERAAEQTKVQTAYGIPIFGIFGFVVAAALMVFVLFGYVRLAEISAETTQLKAAITELKEEHIKLQVEYESTFNLNEIENYAINVLGMTKLDSENVTVISADKQDKAEILNEDISAGGAFTKAADFMKTVAEYFA